MICLEQVLNGQDKCCIPPYYETASTHLVNLFRLLLMKKKPQLLEGLAQFQNGGPSSKPLISKLLFAPSLDELHQLNKRKNWENLHDFWLLWDRLWLAHWCWVNSDKYFQGQELRCRTLKACNESSTLFDLYLACREMYTIRPIFWTIGIVRIWRSTSRVLFNKNFCQFAFCFFSKHSNLSWLMIYS